MKRYESIRKPRKYPECGSMHISSILYGLPAYSEELKLKIESGRIILGGCCITGDDPMWQCFDCNVELYQKLMSD